MKRLKPIAPDQAKASVKATLDELAARGGKPGPMVLTMASSSALLRGYVDLVPRQEVGEVTQYADHEFHERLGATDAPPVLSARDEAKPPRPHDQRAHLARGPGVDRLLALA